ncbi:MAG: hypothetical protein H7A53_05180 [Akkermansiaceae bacterium]|nr:hypothetical protein [Akkermansiaceae bacterium]
MSPDRTRFRFPVAAAAAVFVFLTAACEMAGKPPVSIAALPEGERLEVTYRSTGCFHNSVEVLRFSGGKVTVFDVEEEWSEVEKAPVTKSHVRVGEKALTVEEKKGLDRLFEFYAGHHRGGCTTVDGIEVKHFRGETLLETLVYADDTCSVSEQPGVVALGEIVARVRETSG